MSVCLSARVCVHTDTVQAHLTCAPLDCVRDFWGSDLGPAEGSGSNVA